MQTLISVFDDASDARRAVERLVQDGFAREDLHLKVGKGAAPGSAAAQASSTVTSDSPAENAALGDRAMHTAEREVALDHGVIETLSNFFERLFGRDHGQTHARRYWRAVGEGRSMLFVDARTDQEAEVAATILHDMGATDVDDHHGEHADVRRPHAGVHLYNREQQPTLRDLVDHRHAREESIMADRAAQVTRENEERAIASEKAMADRDRPK